jgi:hypothetical protein
MKAIHCGHCRSIVLGDGQYNLAQSLSDTTLRCGSCDNVVAASTEEQDTKLAVLYAPPHTSTVHQYGAGFAAGVPNTHNPDTDYGPYG